MGKKPGHVVLRWCSWFAVVMIALIVLRECMGTPTTSWRELSCAGSTVYGKHLECVSPDTT